MYFNDVKVDDEIYSIIYGKGVVTSVLPKKKRISGFYMMQVQYKKQTVHYTEDGIPNWCPLAGCSQTAFYVEHIDLSKEDFSPITKILSYDKILKLIDKDQLEMRCPSGLWRDVAECPSILVQKNIKKSKLHLFKKLEYTGNDRRKD